jgi:hypothetical protein
LNFARSLSVSRAFAIRNRKNFLTGLLYLAVGAGFSIGATFYKLGDPARMGPGYFPFWLGILLAVFGAIVLAGSMRRGTAVEGLPKMDFRPLAWILGALVLFAFMLQPLGLAVSLVVMVLVSSLASHEFEWKGAVLNALVLLAISVGAFIFGLHLQIPLWPSFIG